MVPYFKGIGKPHNNFGALLSMHAELIPVQTWGTDFFSDLDVGTCIFYENVMPIETFNRISHNMVLNFLHRGKGGKVMVSRNLIKRGGLGLGPTSSPP